MSSDNKMELHDLLSDATALKESMDRTLEGTTEDHAKWVSFKNVARTHAGLVQRYAKISSAMPKYLAKIWLITIILK